MASFGHWGLAINRPRLQISSQRNFLFRRAWRTATPVYRRKPAVEIPRSYGGGSGRVHPQDDCWHLHHVVTLHPPDPPKQDSTASVALANHIAPGHTRGHTARERGYWAGERRKKRHARTRSVATALPLTNITDTADPYVQRHVVLPGVFGEVPFIIYMVKITRIFLFVSL